MSPPPPDVSSEPSLPPKGGHPFTASTPGSPCLEASSGGNSAPFLRFPDSKAHLFSVELIPASQNVITAIKATIHLHTPFHWTLSVVSDHPLHLGQGAEAQRLRNSDKITQPISSACLCSRVFPAEPDRSSETGLPTLSSAHPISPGHATSIYSINRHLGGTSSEPGTALGRGHTPHRMNETHCLHFSSPSLLRGPCVSTNAQMPSVDVSYCHQTTQAGPHTRPPAEVRAPDHIRVPLLLLYSVFTALLCPRPVLCLSAAFAFAWCGQERPCKIRVTIHIAFPRTVLVYIRRGAVNRLMF